MTPSALRDHTAFLITAAGTSSRFALSAGGGLPVKKEFLLLGGTPLLARTLGACLESRAASTFVVVYTPGLRSETEEALASVHASVHFVSGGQTRQDSVCCGLAYLNELPDPPRYVLIHDGARPWIPAEVILRVLESTVSRGAAAPVIPLPDAVKQIGEDSRITGHLDRSTTASIQTPQGFLFSEILEAHRRAAGNGKCYVDDTELYTDYIGEVYTVAGDIANRKVTYPSDLEQAEGDTVV